MQMHRHSRDHFVYRKPVPRNPAAAFSGWSSPSSHLLESISHGSKVLNVFSMPAFRYTPLKPPNRKGRGERACTATVKVSFFDSPLGIFTGMLASGEPLVVGSSAVDAAAKPSASKRNPKTSTAVVDFRRP